MKTRIIAKLDVKPPYVVKPVHFEGLRKVGMASVLAKKYYDQGADEVVYIDIVSSLYQRNIIFDEVEKTANELFIPFSVGGAVRSVDDFSKLFHITREEGVGLIKRFDGEFPHENFKIFLKYCGITEDHYFNVIDSWRSPHLWDKIDGEWILKHPIWKENK